MNRLSDQQLLQEYLEGQREEAFRELVRRYIDLVYSAALRMVNDPHLAEDVAQNVFASLAQNAGQLTDRAVLSGWLHRATQNLAANAVRTEVRRRRREQEAATMNETMSSDSNSVWTHIAPHLDDALTDLNDLDRDALLLRYFENKSLREVGQLLGTNDDAAQKRVGRALDRVRDFLVKRGATIGAAGLAVVISENAVQAAPAGLLISVSTASPVTLKIVQGIIMSTKAKVLLALVVVVLAAGTATYIKYHPNPSADLAQTAVTVDLDKYTGRFDVAGHTMIIRKNGKGISVGGTDGGAPFSAYPQTENEFVSHDQGSITKLTFTKDAAGKVTGFKLVRDGRVLGDLQRIEEK